MQKLWRNTWFKVLFIIISITFLGQLYSLWLYRTKFNGSLSNDLKDWAEFGDYLSGTSGLFLGFINVCVSIAIAFVVQNFSKDVSNQQLNFQREQDLERIKQQALSEERQLNHEKEIVKLQIRFQAVNDLR